MHTPRSACREKMVFDVCPECGQVDPWAWHAWDDDEGRRRSTCGPCWRRYRLGKTPEASFGEPLYHVAKRTLLGIEDCVPGQVVFDDANTPTVRIVGLPAGVALEQVRLEHCTRERYTPIPHSNE